MRPCGIPTLPQARRFLMPPSYRNLLYRTIRRRSAAVIATMLASDLGSVGFYVMEVDVVTAALLRGCGVEVQPTCSLSTDTRCNHALLSPTDVQYSGHDGAFYTHACQGVCSRPHPRSGHAITGCVITPVQCIDQCALPGANEPHDERHDATSSLAS